MTVRCRTSERAENSVLLDHPSTQPMLLVLSDTSACSRPQSVCYKYLLPMMTLTWRTVRTCTPSMTGQSWDTWASSC